MRLVSGKISGGTGEDFSRCPGFVVGDGSMIRFWHQVWCGDQALKIAFLELFGIARLKGASMVDHLQLSSDSSMECQSYQSDA
jgi:hypothetical protein